MVDRRSPTPPHNTAQFAAWIGFAETVAEELAPYPTSPEVERSLADLERFRALFDGWRDERARPAPSERTEHVVAFLVVRDAAVKLLGDLAKRHPDIATAQLKKHRDAFDRMRKEGRR